MSKLSQVQKIAKFLQDNPNQKFTARQIALAIVEKYPDDYLDKRKGFATENEFISQIVAEIGSSKERLFKQEPNITIQYKPRPQLYWYEDKIQEKSNNGLLQNKANKSTPKIYKFSENDLYPILINYLSQELNLHCLRIDEKSSKNTLGKNGNQWLHPDIVAMEEVSKGFDSAIANCIKGDIGQKIRLWSFEVKKELNGSNVRSSFFQAVSKSSWANEGYLVATAINGKNTVDELRMLSALHGIGVIVLNINDITESEIILPAQRKAQIDWQSVNRILVENRDFKKFIEYVSDFNSTGRIIKDIWNK